MTTNKASANFLQTMRLFQMIRFYLSFLFRNPTLFLKKVRYILINQGVRGFIKLIIRKIFTSLNLHGCKTSSSNYNTWIQRYDSLSNQDIEFIKQDIETLTNLYKFATNSLPKFTIIMPTYNSDIKFLSQCISSVKDQIYTNWELILVDDASSNDNVKAFLKSYESEKNIKVIYRNSNGGIAAASQDGLSVATGDWVTFVDHDDLIPHHALYRVGKEIIQNPNLEFIYSDEDLISESNHRFNPVFKPEFDSERLMAMNYICHLSVYKRDRLLKIGGFRSGVDGAQDWDLVLRYTKDLEPYTIRRIPEILYHWRVHSTSTASGIAAKPYVVEAQKKVVRDFLGDCKVDYDYAHQMVKVTYPPIDPKVSIIILTKDKLKLLKTCIDGIFYKTDYKNLEILIIDNGSVEENTLNYLKSIKNEKIKIIRDDSEFNFAKLNNKAVSHSTGKYLLFMNNDIEVLEKNWLNEMVSVAARSKVGAVGAKLLFPNRTIQHTGVIYGIANVAGHGHKGDSESAPGYLCWNVIRHQVSAVTGACLLVKKALFLEVGGFDDVNLKIAFNDVDFCLKLLERGYKNIFTPFAKLIHHESLSRGYENTPFKFKRFENEKNFLNNKWKAKYPEDPFYSPNLSFENEDFSFAFPSRARKLWEEDAIKKPVHLS